MSVWYDRGWCEWCDGVRDWTVLMSVWCDRGGCEWVGYGRVEMIGCGRIGCDMTWFSMSERGAVGVGVNGWCNKVSVSSYGAVRVGVCVGVVWQG